MSSTIHKPSEKCQMRKYKNQERYEDKRKEEGLVKVTVWTPKQWTNKIKDYGADLRSQHRALQRGASEDL